MSERHQISADSLDAGASFKIATAAAVVHHRPVTWIESHGQVVAAIIPAENYHDPGACCCKNCPWGGNHV